MTNRRRGNLELFQELLETFPATRGQARTRLHLSGTQITDYLEYLQAVQLIKVQKQGKGKIQRFQITSKGKEALELFRQLAELFQPDNKIPN